MTRDPIIHQQDISFETILDETCERLSEKKAQYSIARLVQLEAALESMKKELDEFLKDFEHEK
ncbi:MAG: hypothetical protein LBI40_02845 [Treponema sp.]|jgi:hypothetical protein|nr:hypothetical protein [Treponema sp.]